MIKLLLLKVLARCAVVVLPRAFDCLAFSACSVVWTFNKIVNGEQVTIKFHVDDLKISHKEQSVLDVIYLMISI
jgi:hypothetical protein